MKNNEKLNKLDKIEKQNIDRSDIARMKGKQKRDVEIAMKLATQDIIIDEIKFLSSIKKSEHWLSCFCENAQDMINERLKELRKKQ